MGMVTVFVSFAFNATLSKPFNTRGGSLAPQDN
jgi:hypothetical protein